MAGAGNPFLEAAHFVDFRSATGLRGPLQAGLPAPIPAGNGGFWGNGQIVPGEEPFGIRVASIGANRAIDGNPHGFPEGPT